MGNQQVRESRAPISDEGGRTEKTPEYMLSPTLLPYLDSAWRNSQHYDTSRMMFYRYYFIFAGLGFLLHTFAASPSIVPYALTGASLFITLFGLITVNISIRYKERIVRDIRVIYRINDLLLNDAEEMKSVKNIFLGYRKPQGPAERRIRARLSTTQFFIFIIALISAGLLMLDAWIVFAATPLFLFVTLLSSFVLFGLVYLLSKHGVAFNI